MKRMVKYQTLVGIILIAILTGCAAPASLPPPTPAVPPVSTPALTSTATPIAWQPIHGLAYSPYRDCQSPDTKDQPTLDDIRQDLQIIRGMANGIRTYSSTGINAGIPALARQVGLSVSAGAWLSQDKAANEREIQGLIELAQKVDLQSVIVGNEVLLRGDLSEDELLGYIERVKNAVHVPVTTAEIGSVLLAHPRIMAAVDFEMVHLYPFWGGASVDGAAQSVIDDYHIIQEKSGGKRVVIGETGWPSAGPANNAAVPSPENQAQFAREFLSLAIADQVDFYYFDAFDEMWKSEGGVGAHWGLLDANRTYKSDVRNVMVSYQVTPQPPEVAGGSPAAPNGTPQVTSQGTPGGAGPADFYVYSNFADQQNHFAPGGWMGDISSISVDPCYTNGQVWPKTVFQVSYAPSENDARGWAGIYWLQPDGNWGTLPNAGFDLSAYKQLVFRARAEAPGTQIKFFVGGVSQSDDATPVPLPYPSSIKTPRFAQEADPVDGFINLTDTWQEYHIDLSATDLHYVIDGFGWAAERARTPQGATFYLDGIRFCFRRSGAGNTPTVAHLQRAIPAQRVEHGS